MNKQLQGKVISDKQDKGVIVKVARVKQHPRYKKRYEVHDKYKAHDEENECSEGDEVIIEETRPISKGKKWKVIEINPSDNS